MVKRKEEVAQEGHNRPPIVGGVETKKLIAYIERIENLEEEKAALTGDIGDVFAEAKATGLDVKTMRQIIKLRKMKDNEREESEYLLDLYKRAVGLSVEDVI
jgi:uncharacterized protein (UPF0335 family)